MKNITLSAPDDMLLRAREYAAEDNTTLNGLFRQMVADYIARKEAKARAARLKDLHASFDRLSFTSARKYTREEMNER
jgi:hypothetical protein